MHRNITSSLLLLIVCCGVLLPVRGVTAQDAQNDDVVNWRKVELNFKGGTVAEYISALKNYVKSANVMVDPRASRVPLDQIELKEVDLFAAIEFLNGIEESVDGELIQIDVDYNPPNNPHAQGIWVIRGETRGKRPEPVRTHVLSVADLLQGETPMSPETVLSAVEIGLSLAPASDVQATIRFHEETGLLMARGHVNQLGTIDDVVSQLRSSYESKANEYIQQSLAMERSEFKTRIGMLDAEYRGQIEALSVQLAELRAQNNVLEDTIRELRESLFLQRRETEANLDRFAAERAEYESSLRQQQNIITELQNDLSKARSTDSE
jgi:hypothetical protein